MTSLRFHPIRTFLPLSAAVDAKCPKSAILPADYMSTTSSAPLPKAPFIDPLGPTFQRDLDWKLFGGLTAVAFGVWFLIFRRK